MTESYMKSYGSLEAYENGHQIRDMQFDAESDGKNINFSIRDGDTEYSGHEKLNEDARMTLLNCPSSNMSLEERLLKDFQLSSTNPFKSKKDKKNKKKSGDKKESGNKKESGDKKESKESKEKKDKKDTRKKRRHVKERNTKKK